MKTNQRYVPDFGYDAPKWTKKPCGNPAFLDHNYHRIGKFTVLFALDDLQGYIVQHKCVNCGREFRRAFIPSKREWPEYYKLIYDKEKIDLCQMTA